MGPASPQRQFELPRQPQREFATVPVDLPSPLRRNDNVVLMGNPETILKRLYAEIEKRNQHQFETG